MEIARCGMRNRLARPERTRMFGSVQSGQIHRAHRDTAAADAVRARPMPIAGIPGLRRKPMPELRLSSDPGVLVDHVQDCAAYFGIREVG